MMPPPSRAAAALLLLLLAIVAPFARALGVRDWRFPAAAIKGKGGGPAVLPPGPRPVDGAEAEREEAVGAAAAADDDEGDDAATTTLRFVGRASTVSPPAPRAPCREFFALPRAAPLLLRGSKDNAVEELERIDAELWDKYARSCREVDASPPGPDDRVFEVTTPGVTFLPGLRVTNVATVGVKLIDDDDGEDDLPGYELVFVRSATRAEGNRLLVWCFDRAMGKDGTGGDGDGDDDRGESDGESDGAPTRMSSLTRIRTVPDGDDGARIRFAYDASLCVSVKCPSFLVRIVPGASKERSERTGGASLTGVLERDCRGSLELFHREYVRWRRGGSLRL